MSNNKIKPISFKDESSVSLKTIKISEEENIKQVSETMMDSPHYKSVAIRQMPSSKKFREMSNDEKKEVLNAMIADGLNRTEIAYALGISESRISQLVGQKRETKDVVVEPTKEGFVLKFDV